VVNLRFESATPVPKQAGIPTNLGNGVSERIGAVEKDGERLLVTFIRHAPSLWVNNAGGGQLAPLTQVAQHFLVNRAQDFVDRGSLEGKLTTRIGTAMPRLWACGRCNLCLKGPREYRTAP